MNRISGLKFLKFLQGVYTGIVLRQTFTRDSNRQIFETHYCNSIWYDSTSSSTCKNIKVISLEGQEKKPKLPSSGDRGGSTHANQKIGLFKADVMRQCINKLNRVEAEAKRHGTKPKSRNKTWDEFGLSPSTVSKRISSDIPLSFFSLEEMSS